jgi:hypothetical protein
MLERLVKVPENSRTRRMPGIFPGSVPAKRLQAEAVL